MAKGGDFERDISKFLTKWLTGKVKPYMFWRMPASGGLATIHEENIGLAGDIRSIHSDAEFFTNTFTVECKTGYPRTSFWQHFKGIKNFPLELFWKQTCDESSGKQPMLIYRKKGNKPIVGITDQVWVELSELKPIYELRSISLYFGDINELPRVIFFDMNDLFKMIEPDDIREVGNQLGGVSLLH